ncbi:MAG: MFS transporter [Oscillospiraceae bacterium]|nr:MFS transporter [Oscillospiraceae bacterium]
MGKSLWSKNYILVVVSATVFYFISFMLNSVSARHGISMNGSGLITGVVVSGFTMASFFTRPLWGHICIKKGRKKVLMAGALICVLASLMFIFTSGITIFIVARCIFGAGYSAVTTSGGTMVCDIAGEKYLSKAVSYYGISSVVSQAMAPAAGLWLYEKSFTTLSVVIATGAALVWGTGLFIKYHEDRFIKPGEKFKLYEKQSLPAAYTIIPFAMVTASVYAFIPVMAEERQLSYVGLFFALSAAGLLVGRIFNTKICAIAGEKEVFYTGAVLLTAGLAMIAFAYNSVVFLFSAVCYGCGAGFVHPVANIRAVKNSPDRQRSIATGTFMMSQDLGMTVGAVLWGIISRTASFTVVYVVASVIILVMMYVFHKFLSPIL